MATDIKLNKGDNKNWIEAECAVFAVSGSDLILDSKARRGDGGQGGFRRAMVHGQGDTLIINFNHDYKGGTAIAGARLNLHVNEQAPGAAKLPKKAAIGDLCMVRNRREVRMDNPAVERLEQVSLWLCTGKTDVTQVALWSPIPLGEAVVGELD
jgi:hypothetical protein